MKRDVRRVGIAVASAVVVLAGQACSYAVAPAPNTGDGGTGNGVDGASPCNAPDACAGTLPPQPCTAATQCPNQRDPLCATPACTDGYCNYTYAPVGQAYPAQVQGDCQKKQCDGAGAVQSVPDLTDVPTQVAGDCRKRQCTSSGTVEEVADDTNLPASTGDCATPACSNGSPQQTPKSAGALCSSGGDRYCNGLGTCVYCPPVDQACSEPGPATAANNAQATAYDLGTQSDDDSAGREECGVLQTGTGDVDWYHYHGYSACCFFQSDPSALIVSSVPLHLCIYSDCPASQFVCPSGTTDAFAPNGAHGCCQDRANPGMDVYSCSDGANGSGVEVWMSVNAVSPVAQCTGYDMRFHF